MGTKVTIPPVGNPESSSFVTKLNSALDKLADEFDKIPYRDGSFAMQGPLDMGAQRIYNLPAPLSSSEPLRQLDIPWALRGEQGIQGAPGDVAKSDTRAALAALALPANGTVRYLGEEGREGIFTFSTANLSSQVLADTQQGFYVAPSGAPSGASGAWVRRFDGTINPRRFGAKGGAFDDTVPITNALIAAFTLGVPVDGGTEFFSVSGDLNFTAYNRPRIKSLCLKQLTPNAVARRTISFTNCNYIEIDNLVVDKGTLGTAGSLSDAAGVWVVGGTGHRITGIEVFGASRGAGIAIHSVTNSYLAGLHARNLTYDNVAATDDQINAIWLNACTNTVVLGPRSYSHTGNGVGSGTIAWRHTRGIIVSGCVRLNIISPTVNNVDQGVDFSGSAGNVECNLTGGTIKDCGIYGVKLANSAYYCKVNGVTVVGAGIAAFVASGPAEAALPFKTEGNEFNDCTAIDTGSNGIGIGVPTGFAIMQSAFNTDYPKGVRFNDCTAIDRQTVATMQYGFRSDVVYDGTSKLINQLSNCKSHRHTVAAESGFHRIVAKVTGTTNQTILNNTITAIDWNTDTEDTVLMHSLLSNANQIVPFTPGLYRIWGHIEFTSNANGFRRAQIHRSGGAVGYNHVVNAINGTVTSIDFDEELTCIVGNYFDVRVEQNSGASLDVDRAKSFFAVELIRET